MFGEIGNGEGFFEKRLTHRMLRGESPVMIPHMVLVEGVIEREEEEPRERVKGRRERKRRLRLPPR